MAERYVVSVVHLRLPRADGQFSRWGARCRAPSFPWGVRAERGVILTVGVCAAAALRAAVPAPTGRTGQRSAFPGRRAMTLGGVGVPPGELPSAPACRAPSAPATGTCREGGHPEGWGLRGRGPAGRCADQRSAFPCQPVVTVGGVGVTVAGSAVHKEEPRGRLAPGFPFDFRSDGFQETQIPTSPRT